MLSLEFIRANPDAVRRAGELKGEPAPVDEILDLDQEWRARQHRAEEIKAEQNELSKQFAKTRDEALKARLRQMADAAKSELALADALKSELDDLLLRVPNLFHESVPIGETEAENVVIREWGEKPDLGFVPRTHFDLGESLGIWTSSERCVSRVRDLPFWSATVRAWSAGWFSSCSTCTPASTATPSCGRRCWSTRLRW